MKKSTIFLFAILLPILLHSENIVSTKSDSQKHIHSNLLDSIQSKIYNVFVADMTRQENVEMKKLNRELLSLSKEKSNAIINYWLGYLQFYQGIFYLQTKQNENAKNEINKGIDIINEIKSKTSEDYALLSRLQSISLQFAGMKVMSLSKVMTENSKTALKLDPENLRANFIYGSNDFYTPEMYGGGKEAEKYLLKAISLPEQKISNKYLPSWGKDEAYEMLIKFYLKKGNKDKAKHYYEEAIKLYPQNFMIMQLSGKIQ